MSRATIAFACLFAATVATPALAVRDTTYFTSLTVFGDSLVDAGNVRIATGGAIPSPAAGYVDGRFTNGYDYTDLLNRALFGGNTVASLAGGTNFAFGGARATTTSNVPDLVEQLATYDGYLAQPGKAVDTNGLYVLTFGGNDIFAAQTGAIPPDYATKDAFLRDAAAKIAGGVQRLDTLGARNIFLTDFPVASLDAVTANGYLTDALAALTLGSDTTVFRYDTLDFFTRITANPGAFGLAPFDQPGFCQQGGAAAIDNGCSGYFSFDGIHPVAAVQQALFEDIDAQFGLTAAQAAVPEPATWAMMLLGFGIVGVAVRRRRAAMRTA